MSNKSASAEIKVLSYLVDKKANSKEKAISQKEMAEVLGFKSDRMSQICKQLEYKNKIIRERIKEGRQYPSYCWLKNGYQASSLKSQVSKSPKKSIISEINHNSIVDNFEPQLSSINSQLSNPILDERIKKLETQVRILEGLDQKREQHHELIFEDHMKNFMEYVLEEKVTGFNFAKTDKEGKRRDPNTKPFRRFFDFTLKETRRLNE